MSGMRELMNELKQAGKEQAWSRFYEIYFRILYGMPEEVQRALVIFMMRRYLPVFHMHWPTVIWPEHILDQPEQWIIQHGRAVPEEPDGVNPADAGFIFSFDALLNGLKNRADHTILTSSYTAAVISTIDARSTNVWIADDPEAAALWEAQKYLPPGRSLIENRASLAVLAREHKCVFDWISGKQHAGFFSPGNPDEIEQALIRWRDHEYSLIISPEPE
jgi:hypothetical protein